MEERYKWFIDRIGKRVYRNNYCSCEVCKHVYENGILLTDKDQATYCYENECEFTADGTPMKYFDTRKEMIEFEKQIKENGQHA